MKDKSKQVWYLYAHDIKELKRQCYDVISTLYVQLGQAPEAEIIVQMTNLFCNDLATNQLWLNGMELEEVRFALNQHIRENERWSTLCKRTNVERGSKKLQDVKSIKKTD